MQHTQTSVRSRPRPRNRAGVPPISDVAKLFRRWLDLWTALEAAYDAENEAECAYNRASPVPPTIILAAGNEALWHQLVKHERDAKASWGLIVGSDGAWIGSQAWQFVLDNPDHFRSLRWMGDGTREEWLTACRDAAERFERCRETVSIGAGRPAAKQAADKLQNELNELDAEIMEKQPRSVDDLKLMTYAATRKGADLPMNGEALVRAIIRMDAGPGAISSGLEWKSEDE